MFKKTYGILYERNSDVFTGFFKDLEAYYENGNLDLEEALRKFFSRLYQRMSLTPSTPLIVSEPSLAYLVASESALDMFIPIICVPCSKPQDNPSLFQVPGMSVKEHEKSAVLR